MTREGFAGYCGAMAKSADDKAVKFREAADHKPTLAEALASHAKWVAGEEGGERADLSGADLRDADLRDANLRGANLRVADLHGAYLRGAYLPAGFRIASLCFGGWPVTITPTDTTIGCVARPNEDWLRWQPDDKVIVAMDDNAPQWWGRHREAVCAVIRDVMQPVG